MTAQQVLIDERQQPLIEERQPDTEALALINKAVELKLGAAEIAQLWAVQKDIKAQASKAAYIEAFNLFKRNPPKITKNRHVKAGSTEFDHATLDHICEMVIPALNAVGISHYYKIRPEGELIYVTCILTHEDGHSEETTLFGMADKTGSKNGIQAIGSAVTYLERYTLLAAVGLAAEGTDDDGKAAGGKLDGLNERLEEILQARDERALMSIFKAHHEAATKAADGIALLKITQAKDKRKAELQ